MRAVVWKAPRKVAVENVDDPKIEDANDAIRVVLPFNIACGFCFNCSRGFSNACLTTNPQSHGGGFGYSGLGPGERQNPQQVLEDCINVTNPTGHVGIIGVYFPEDPRGVDENEKQGKFTLSLGKAWNKGLSFETGQAPVKRYNVYLRDTILAELAKPSMIVSHRIAIEDAPDAYEQFDLRANGYTKVVIKPGMRAGQKAERGEVEASPRKTAKTT